MEPLEMPDKTPQDTSRRLVPVKEVSIPNHYFNGFDISVSLSDINCMLFLDGAPQGRLSMSFTTAKTLSKALSAAIEQFEKITKHDIMTADEVKEGYDKHAKQS